MDKTISKLLSDLENILIGLYFNIVILTDVKATSSLDVLRVP